MSSPLLWGHGASVLQLANSGFGLRQRGWGAYAFRQRDSCECVCGCCHGLFLVAALCLRRTLRGVGSRRAEGAGLGKQGRKGRTQLKRLCQFSAAIIASVTHVHVTPAAVKVQPAAEEALPHFIPINEQTGDIPSHHLHKAGKGLYGKRGANDDKRVANAQISFTEAHKPLREALDREGEGSRI